MEPVLAALVGATGSALVSLVYTITAEWRRHRRAGDKPEGEEGLDAISARLTEMRSELAAAQRDAQEIANELAQERRRREAS